MGAMFPVRPITNQIVIHIQGNVNVKKMLKVNNVMNVNQGSSISIRIITSVVRLVSVMAIRLNVLLLRASLNTSWFLHLPRVQKDGMLRTNMAEKLI